MCGGSSCIYIGISYLGREVDLDNLTWVSVSLSLLEGPNFILQIERIRLRPLLSEIRSHGHESLP